MAKLKAYLSFVLPFAFLLSSHVLSHELRETSIGKSTQFDNAEVHELGESKRNGIPLASRKMVIGTGSVHYTHPATYKSSNSKATETRDGIIWRSDDTNTDSGIITRSRRDTNYKVGTGREREMDHLQRPHGAAAAGAVGLEEGERERREWTAGWPPSGRPAGEDPGPSGKENQDPCRFLGSVYCDYEKGNIDHPIIFERENQRPYNYEGGVVHWPVRDPADFDTEDGNIDLPIRFNKGEPMNYNDASVMKHHNMGRLSKLDHVASRMSQAKTIGMKNGDKTHYDGVRIMEGVGEKIQN